METWYVNFVKVMSKGHQCAPQQGFEVPVDDHLKKQRHMLVSSQI